MVETVGSLFIGGIVGVLFAFVNVPVPAPPTVAGVAGILGLTLGYMAIGTLRG
jgi:XapX domain-containing protein